MKTIQEYFREANADELVNDYLFSNPITITPATEINPDKTIGELYEGYKRAVYGLIEDIRNVEIKPDADETWVFFVHHCVEDENGSVCVSLAKLSELLDESKNAMSYAYEFSPLAETAGFYVADTYLTQRHIGKVLMDFLFESSFFGFKQEDLDDAVAELEERLEETKDVREHPEKYITFEDMCDRIGWKPEKRDPREKEAWRKLIDAEIEYNKTAAEIEERKFCEKYYEAQSVVG